MQFTLFFCQNVDFISSQCSSFFCWGNQGDSVPKLLNWKWEQKPPACQCGVIQSTVFFMAPCFFFAKQNKHFGDKTVSLEVAIWISGRVIRVLILTQFLIRNHFKNYLLLWQAVFHSTFYTIIQYVYICKFREILCLKMIDTKEMPKRKTCLVFFSTTCRISYFRLTHSFWPQSQQSTQSEKRRLTFFTFQNSILTKQHIATKPSTWNINIDPTELPTSYSTSLTPDPSLFVNLGPGVQLVLWRLWLGCYRFGRNSYLDLSRERGGGNKSRRKKAHLGGGFKHFLFSPLLGEMIQLDEYFSNGLKPPTSHLGRVFFGWFLNPLISKS